MKADRHALQHSMDGFRDETAADRRTFQQAMDQLRTEMQRLAERQSNLDGARTATGD